MSFAGHSFVTNTNLAKFTFELLLEKVQGPFDVTDQLGVVASHRGESEPDGVVGPARKAPNESSENDRECQCHSTRHRPAPFRKKIRLLQ